MRSTTVLVRALSAAALLSACGTGGVLPGVGTPLSSHVPAVVQASLDHGPADPNTALTLTIALPLRDEADLDALLAALYDPTSTQYQQYLTPEQFAARFHPTADQVEAVRANLLAHNIAVDADAKGILLQAQASIADAQEMFHTQIDSFTGPDGWQFYAPVGEVTVPEGLPVQAVFGLHSLPPMRKHLVPLATTGGSKVQFAAADVRTVYSIPASATGDGQILALTELDGYSPADISSYASKNALPAPNLQNILVGGYNGAAGSGQDEVCLDIELMMAMAPKAQIRVYEGSNSGALLPLFNEIANPTDKTLVSSISNSWGLAEDLYGQAEVQAESGVFKQLAAQGQTVFSAAGDAGAYDDGKQISVDDPGSQPYVVSVGGLTLYTNAGKTYDRESTWTDGGGGISTMWTIPTWQNGVLGSGSKGSTTMRNVPDVSLNADPTTGYNIVVQSSSIVVGGTSAAAPLWAAFVGVANQSRAAAGLPPLGFLSPLLYELGKAAGPTMYHDIADGSTNQVYPAVTGFDDATGWGSFTGTTLLTTLSSGYARRTFTAPVF